MIRPAEAFNIEKQIIRAKYPCSITIDSREYDKRSFIETATKYQLPRPLCATTCLAPVLTA